MQDRKTLFGSITWDTTYHALIQIKLRNLIPTPSKFFFNIQTDGTSK